jgi:hypothetical protein
MLENFLFAPFHELFCQQQYQGWDRRDMILAITNQVRPACLALIVAKPKGETARNGRY